eukprot:TRINITY_DN11115_c4_g1_i1.p1 TRINITY_DN11115_c4_g1~~TRINITY_DN11115_c4_g1_i1.p1  ORF type:complete len:166 (-),score=24.98 TRINITY_DN11115_c4_g1_i1:328-825(-)
MAHYSNGYYAYYDDHQHTPHFDMFEAADSTKGMSYVYDSSESTVEFAMGSFTTVCIRDLPCKVDQTRMTYELWRLGFGGTYDLLYLPRRSCGKCLGYGFINFCRPEDAMRFAQVFQDFRFEDIQSSKQSYAEPSRVQGFEHNLYQFVDAIFNQKRGLNTGPLLSF